MKRLLFSLCLLSLAFSVYSQKLASGDLSILSTESRINLICDFSQCRIDGKPADEKIKDEGEEDWAKGVSDIIERFKEGSCKKDTKHCIGNYPEAKYTFVYHFKDIDDDEDIKGYMELIDSQTKEVKAVLIKCNGSAGRFGSFFNLIGDSFESIGKKVRSFIK